MFSWLGSLVKHRFHVNPTAPWWKQEIRSRKKVMAADGCLYFVVEFSSGWKDW